MFESLQILMSTADTYKCIMDGSPFHLMEKVNKQTEWTWTMSRHDWIKVESILCCTVCSLLKHCIGNALYEFVHIIMHLDTNSSGLPPLSAWIPSIQI